MRVTTNWGLEALNEYKQLADNFTVENLHPYFYKIPEWFLKTNYKGSLIYKNYSTSEPYSSRYGYPAILLYYIHNHEEILVLDIDKKFIHEYHYHPSWLNELHSIFIKWLEHEVPILEESINEYNKSYSNLEL